MATDFRTEQVVNARMNAVSGYQASDTDIHPGGTSYYGFLKSNGSWYIMKAVETGAVTAYTYAKGDSGYDFTTRASLTYSTFSNLSW